jgi:hypothetical protein
MDPVLSFSTYLGGSLSDTNAGLAVDPSGSAYVIGITDSSNFPTMSPLQAAPAGGYEMVVAKLDPSGSALVYSTYLGGSGNDRGLEIAVDSSGNAYLTGDTTSVDFPTASPLQATYAGGYDAFVTKLDPSGSALVYSTYLGGSGLDTGEGIAVDSSGSVYLAGPTMSTDFPTVSPLQASYGGGTYDTFAAKLDPSGSALTYSTYLGGSSQDYGERIAVDPSGNAYVTGWTWSTNFPTADAFQPTKAGGNDAFVAKLNPSGTALVYSTYLGGSTDDYGEAIVADSSGNAYVTGHTYSGDFPTVSPLQAGLAGNNDVFVAKLDPSGSTLAYSTYLGGSSFDSPSGIVVDSSGHVHITGTTQSANFPTVNPLQAAHAGSQDAFVAELDISGSTLVFSTFLGGSANEWSSGIGLHSSGDSCVSGSTASVDFPTASPLQAAFAGGSMDFFIAKIVAPIFADDFESGDTSAWSASVP